MDPIYGQFAQGTSLPLSNSFDMQYQEEDYAGMSAPQSVYESFPTGEIKSSYSEIGQSIMGINSPQSQTQGIQSLPQRTPRPRPGQHLQMGRQPPTGPLLHSTIPPQGQMRHQTQDPQNQEQDRLVADTLKSMDTNVPTFQKPQPQQLRSNKPIAPMLIEEFKLEDFVSFMKESRRPAFKIQKHVTLPGTSATQIVHQKIKSLADQKQLSKLTVMAVYNCYKTFKIPVEGKLSEDNYKNAVIFKLSFQVPRARNIKDRETGKLKAISEEENREFLFKKVVRNVGNPRNVRAKVLWQRYHTNLDLTDHFLSQIRLSLPHEQRGYLTWATIFGSPIFLSITKGLFGMLSAPGRILPNTLSDRSTFAMISWSDFKTLYNARLACTIRIIRILQNCRMFLHPTYGFWMKFGVDTNEHENLTKRFKMEDFKDKSLYDVLTFLKTAQDDWTTLAAASLFSGIPTPGMHFELDRKTVLDNAELLKNALSFQKEIVGFYDMVTLPARFERRRFQLGKRSAKMIGKKVVERNIEDLQSHVLGDGSDEKVVFTSTTGASLASKISLGKTEKEIVLMRSASNRMMRAQSAKAQISIANSCVRYLNNFFELVRIFLFDDYHNSPVQTFVRQSVSYGPDVYPSPEVMSNTVAIELSDQMEYDDEDTQQVTIHSKDFGQNERPKEEEKKSSI